MSKLISGIIGFSFGVFLCGVTFSFVEKFGWPHTMDVLNSALVAISLFLALYIHDSSHRQQQADRRWDINKDVLLELTHSLHQVNQGTETAIGNHRHGSEHHIKVDSNVWTTLDEKISYTLNVYKPLMDKALIKLIHDYQTKHNDITVEVNFHDLDTLSAHEEMLIKGKELHGKLQEFIGEVSGIRKAG